MAKGLPYYTVDEQTLTVLVLDEQERKYLRSVLECSDDNSAIPRGIMDEL